MILISSFAFLCLILVGPKAVTQLCSVAVAGSDLLVRHEKEERQQELRKKGAVTKNKNSFKNKQTNIKTLLAHIYLIFLDFSFFVLPSLHKFFFFSWSSVVRADTNFRFTQTRQQQKKKNLYSVLARAGIFLAWFLLAVHFVIYLQRTFCTFFFRFLSYRGFALFSASTCSEGCRCWMAKRWMYYNSISRCT